MEKMAKTDKEDIKKYVISSKDLEEKIEKIVKNRLLKDKEIEDKFVDISKNVIIQLYKTLWVKRNFWSTALKNKSV